MKKPLQKTMLIAMLALFGLSNVANAQWVQSLVNNDEVSWITSDATNMFAGTNIFGGKMYKSTDNGATWNTSNSGLASQTVECIAISGNTILAGTLNGGVFKSTDNGATWTASNTGLTNLKVIRITVDGNNIYAGTFNGIFLSTDNGSTWAPKNTGIETVAVNAILVNGTDIFIGTNSDTVLRSSDGGNSWVSKSSGFTHKAVSSFVVSGNKIFAGSQGLDAVFVTTDNGESWTAANTGIPSSTPIMGMEIIGINIFAISYFGQVYHSADDGSNWIDISTGLPSTTGGKLHIKGANIFAATSGEGVWKRALSELGINVGSTPSAPTNLTITPGKTQVAGQMTLDWTDNSSDEDGFLIERSTDNISFTIIDTVIANIVTFSDTGLPASTEYYYKIAAYNSAGNSGYSNTVNATTLNTGIISIVTQSQFSIFPNPSPGKFTLNSTEKINSVTIYNMIGETVYQSQNHQSEIDLSQNPDGIYFVQIKSAEKIYNQKIVKE